ncbi:hypothetical protein [Microcoleus asticus]|nr:hypothetical protein [Microcoleus asticus]
MTVTFFGELEGVWRCFSVDGAKYLVGAGSGSTNPSSNEFLGMVLLLSD